VQCTNLLLHSIKAAELQTRTNSPQNIISRTVWILSLVSLFTDMASEMLYPVMPVFLQKIGFSILLIGILEGVAEAVAGLSKSYFGKLSDRSGKRLPFVQLGYALSAVSKPMMAVFFYPAWIFLARTIDRVGKGIRTGARDAILSSEATPATKARVFGLHRSMDTAGAVIGPALALAYLYYYPGGYTALFLLAFIPGLLAVLATFLLREKRESPPEPAAGAEGWKINSPPARVPFFAFATYWKQSPPGYKKLVAGLLVFALINSSDVFLLLKMKESGLPDTTVIGVYIFYNLVYALAAFPVGILADKIGLKKVLVSGLLVFAAVYAGFAFSKTFLVYLLLFCLYALYAAATEGISKALISNIVHKKESATALGTYAGFQSIAALFASMIAGLLWFKFGALAAFLVAAGVAIGVAIYLAALTNGPLAATGEATGNK
jgi:MFS family permease